MSRYQIFTPVKDASGDLGPIHFHQGKAEVDEIPYGVRQYCELNGYMITDTQADEDGVPDDDGDPMTPPPGNGKASAWREHVLAIGGDRVTAEQVAALDRTQLKELAGQLAEPPAPPATQEGQNA